MAEAIGEQGIALVTLLKKCELYLETRFRALEERLDQLELRRKLRT